jgi:hypothetical protein
MKAETEAFRAEMKAMRDKRMKANNDTQEKTMACQEKTEERLGEEEPASVEMKPEVAQEVPLEDAARMPVGKTRNRRRDRRNLAAERHQKKQEKRPQRKNGCRGNLAVARRGTTRRVQVARRRRLFTMKTRNYRAS